MRKLYKSLSIKVDGKIIKHYKNLSLKNIEGEIWKDIVDFEGLYQVSNFGRVKSLAKNIRGRYSEVKGEYSTATRKEIIKKQKIDRYEYNVVNLSPLAQDNVIAGKRKHITVHRLVAVAFVPNPENKSQINHKNGVKYNNVPDNLQWSTIAENNDHAINVLHRKASTKGSGKFGKDNWKSKPIFQYDLKGNLIKEFDNIRIAAESLGKGKDPQRISTYLYFKKKKDHPYKVNHAYGYHWALNKVL